MSDDLIDYRPASPRCNDLHSTEYAVNNQGFVPDNQSANESETEQLVDEEEDTVAPLEHHSASFSRANSDEANPKPLVCLLRQGGSDSAEGSPGASFGDFSSIEKSGLSAYPIHQRRLSTVSVTEFLASNTVQETMRAQRLSIPTHLFASPRRDRRCSEPAIITTRKLSDVVHSTPSQQSTSMGKDTGNRRSFTPPLDPRCAQSSSPEASDI